MHTIYIFIIHKMNCLAILLANNVASQVLGFLNLICFMVCLLVLTLKLGHQVLVPMGLLSIVGGGYFTAYCRKLQMIVHGLDNFMKK